ncbi:MAG: hypothetical protein ACI35R_11370 [Bacillus sp. (in: firmicutes)]
MMKFDFSIKSHRILAFFMVFIPILIVGIILTFLSQNNSRTQEEPKTKVEESISDSSQPEKEKEVVKYPEFEITEEDRKESKLIAEKFVKAYATYDAEKPEEFIQNSYPYLSTTYAAYWDNNIPRKPLATVTSTVKELDTYPIDGGDKYEIAWNVVATVELKNPLGDLITQEDWYWIILEKENDQWKIKRMDVENAK